MLRADISFRPQAGHAPRVVLVGFMGAGKTSLAERWARSAGASLWFDSDVAVLRDLACTTVADAFRDHGEDGFRAAEARVIAAREPRLRRGLEVWSLGGGAPVHPDVRRLLADACVVWLDAPAKVLWARIAGSDRPLARDWAAFERLWHARRELYAEVSHVRIDATADLAELGLGRELASLLPTGWFGSSVAVGDGLLQRMGDLAAVTSAGSVAIVADRAVDTVAGSLRHQLEATGAEILSDVRLPMGEWNKQLGTVERLLRAWADAGLHSGSRVLAIGGGTLLDTVGLAASVYHRGMGWVAVPTTLTSQVDAGIGGKTGVNLGAAKNVVGTVHMPLATLIDPRVLATLDAPHVRDGMVEAGKTGLLAGAWLLERVEALAADIASSRSLQGDAHQHLLDVVEGCACFKDAVVAEDPFESDGIRHQLNLGHTVGHAIEAATGGAVSHGAAVAIGLHLALHLSRLVLDADDGLVERWNLLCTALDISVTSPLSWDAIEPFLTHDKKRDEHGIGWVLMADVGDPVTGVRIPLAAARRVWDQHVRREDSTVSMPGVDSPKRRVVPSSHRQPRVLVLFGANLDQLGQREVEHYGSASLAQLVGQVELWAAERQLVADCRHTDSLERFLHALHEARVAHDAVIVNPGAWTHHEYAIHDALAALALPRVEVHLSDPSSREAWRRVSVVRPAVDRSIEGLGAEGYREALDWLVERLASLPT